MDYGFGDTYINMELGAARFDTCNNLCALDPFCEPVTRGCEIWTVFDNMRLQVGPACTDPNGCIF